jgi:hypothetical protein
VPSFFKTLEISLTPFEGSGKCSITPRAETFVNVLSSNGRFSPSPQIKLPLPLVTFFASCNAFSDRSRPNEDVPFSRPYKTVCPTPQPT